MSDLERQPISRDSHCPECGGEPMAEEVISRLSNLGYLHDDHAYKCTDCGYSWDCGIPIGDFDRPDMADDLWCDSCNQGYMLVHRVEIDPEAFPDADIALHLKCPNENCHYFTRIPRDTDSVGRLLIGYPQISGRTDGAEPYGY